MPRGEQTEVVTPGVNGRMVAFLHLAPLPTHGRQVKYNLFAAKKSRLFKAHVSQLLRLVKEAKGFSGLVPIVDRQRRVPQEQGIRGVHPGARLRAEGLLPPQVRPGAERGGGEGQQAAEGGPMLEPRLRQPRRHGL